NSGSVATCDTTFREFYNYNPAGARLGKRLEVERQMYNSFSTVTTMTQDLDGAYTYDTEGRMLTQSIPMGPTLTNTYDSMGRLTTLNDGTSSVISSTTYGPAGELTAMSGAWGSESRGYNAMLQMVHLVSGSTVDMYYDYSSTQNNGKITAERDNL